MNELPDELVRVIGGVSLYTSTLLASTCTRFYKLLQVPPLLINGVERDLNEILDRGDVVFMAFTRGGDIMNNGYWQMNNKQVIMIPTLEHMKIIQGATDRVYIRLMRGGGEWSSKWNAGTSFVIIGGTRIVNGRDDADPADAMLNLCECSIYTIMCIAEVKKLNMNVRVHVKWARILIELCGFRPY